MNTPKNIILLSSAQDYAQEIADMLHAQYGLKCATVDELVEETDSQHMVSISNSKEALSDLHALGYIADLDKYPTDKTDEVSSQIFDDACDSFLGHLSVEELAHCA